MVPFYLKTHDTAETRQIYFAYGSLDTPQDLVAPVITLNGAQSVNHECGSAFVDPGASAFDAVDGPAPVATSGTVDGNVLGTQEISYMATDRAGNSSLVKRGVTVRDTTVPALTLNGPASMTLEHGVAFPDRRNCRGGHRDRCQWGRLPV